ncbi:MAG: tetratricopeptide repeat protein [Verrucomicrobia bacterium]|nr:tetratricopeptide repeat protein [Verrucomicrobiota bacterium]
MIKNKKYLRLILALGCILLPSACTRVPEQIEPKIDYSVQDRYLLKLPSPFEPLSEEESKAEWAREYKVAMGFAHELDLYQAITAFKRAVYLLPKQEKKRKLELQYEILLCYYIGKKYPEVIQTFESSGLHFVGAEFTASHDLLTILFDSYNHIKEPEKADKILQYMEIYYPEDAQKLSLSRALLEGNLPLIEKFSTSSDFNYLSSLLTCYDTEKKSIQKAQIFNALLPGAGYLYLGQKQSAMTAFLLNGLFIGASYYFFHKGNIPAGVIFTGFESGWYFGGIYGAGEEAKFYNERMYEKCATPVMNKHQLFPILSLRYAF